MLPAFCVCVTKKSSELHITLSNKRLALSAFIISHPTYHITSHHKHVRVRNLFDSMRRLSATFWRRKWARNSTRPLNLLYVLRCDMCTVLTLQYVLRCFMCVCQVGLEIPVKSEKNWEIRGACPPPIRFEVSLWANFLFLFIPLMSEEQNNDLQPKACWASFSSLMGVFCVSEPVCVSVAKWRSDTYAAVTWAVRYEA